MRGSMVALMVLPMITPCLVAQTAVACTAPASATPQVYARLTLPAAGDTAVRLTVCFATGTRTGTPPVAGYHGELRLAAGTRVIGVERPGGGMRVENATTPGRVSFAGVVPAGLTAGPLLTLTLLRRSDDGSANQLVMLDLTDARGQDVTARVSVDTIARRIH